MKDGAQRSIFRIEAIKRNSRGGGEAILPRFSSPRIIWLLWIFVGLAIAGGLLLWLVRVPVYTAAVAIPLASDNREPLMAVLIPARNAGQVHVGQHVFWRFGKTEQRVTRTIVEVEQSVRSPHSLREELGTQSITEPAVVAFVKLDPVPDGVPASAYAGSMYKAEVEVGTRRVLSLLPFVGRFIGN
jgi:hypothetical protein